MANSLSYQEEKKSAAGYLQYKENVGKLDRSSEMKKKKKRCFLSWEKNKEGIAIKQSVPSTTELISDGPNHWFELSVFLHWFQKKPG